VVVNLERGADCLQFAYGPADATASRNPIIFCLIQTQTGFTFLVPAYPRKEAVNFIHDIYREKNIAIAGISRYWFCDSSYQIKALVIINLEWKSLGLCVTLQTPVCVFVLLQKTGRKRAAMV